MVGRWQAGKACLIVGNVIARFMREVVIREAVAFLVQIFARELFVAIFKQELARAMAKDDNMSEQMLTYSFRTTCAPHQHSRLPST